MNHARKVFAALAVSLALAGCGSEAGPTVASAANASGTPAPTSTGDPVARYIEGQRKWVACIRKQGFDLPDPDAKGQVDFGALGDNRRLKADPKWTAAQQACTEFISEVPAELDPTEPLTPEQLANLRAYSECRRANGSPDFPDPGPDGRLPQNGDRELTPQEQTADNLSAGICDPVLRGRPPADPGTVTPGQG